MDNPPMIDTRCDRCAMPMLVVDDPTQGRWGSCPRCGRYRSAAHLPSWHHRSHQHTCRSERIEHGREAGM